MESDPIPAAIWQRETQHRQIFKNAMPCARCGFKARDVICAKCTAGFCAVCVTEHAKTVCRKPK
jgi:hypothetical protein